MTQLPLLITEANITPLRGLDWMNRLGIALNTTSEDIKIHNIKLDETEKKILKLKNEFKDLFYNNTEIKILSVKINLKEDNTTEGQTNTDSRKLNEATKKRKKRKAQVPNMEELISRILCKISEEKEGEIRLTKLDFDYAYGQIKLDDETQKLCIFTITVGEFTGYYRFFKGFYGLADTPTIFQQRIDKTLEFKHPAWLDDIIIVTKGTIEKHGVEVKETMRKLENAGYRLHPKKCEFFKQESE